MSLVNHNYEFLEPIIKPFSVSYVSSSQQFFSRLGDYLLAFLQGQVLRFLYRLRNSVILFLIRDIRAEATIQDLHFRILIELLDKSLLIFLFFASINSIASSAVIDKGFKPFGMDTNFPS